MATWRDTEFSDEFEMYNTEDDQALRVVKGRYFHHIIFEDRGQEGEFMLTHVDMARFARLLETYAFNNTVED